MESTFFPYFAAFIWIGILFMLGVFLRAKIKILQTYLVPASLIAGVIGFVLVTLGVIGIPTSNGWQTIPHSVFSIMTYHLFAFGFVGIGFLQNKSDIAGKVVIRGGLWMVLLCGLIWAIQSLIGKGIFELWHTLFGGDFYTGLGYLVGAGFAQGPGQAQAHGLVWENTYNIGNVVSVSLAFGAMGFFAAVLIGVPLAKYGIKKGLLQQEYSGNLSQSFLRGIMAKNENPPCALATTHPGNIDNMAFHLGLMLSMYGLAYLFGLLWTNHMPTAVQSLGFGIMFSWGMVFAMLTRYIMKKLDIIHLIDPQTTRRLTSTCVDFMICSAFMAINVEELKSVAMPFILTIIFATLASLLVIMWFARRAPEFGFERGLACYGCYTGTVATGLLLLRIIDPDFESPAAIELAVMNAFALVTLQPLLAGFPLIPMEGFPILAILIGYVVISPIAFYVLRLIKKPSW